MTRHYRIVRDRFDGFEAQRRWWFWWVPLLNCVHSAPPNGRTHNTLEDAKETIEIHERRRLSRLEVGEVVGQFVYAP